MRIEKLPILAIAFLAFVVTTVIYLAWPSYNYQPDSIQAAMAIEVNAVGARYYHPTGMRLFEPGIINTFSEDRTQEVNMRYLLEYPTSNLVYTIWRSFERDGLVVTPLVVFRALVGGVGVFFFVLAMFELTDNRLLAFLVGLGWGVSASYWTFATDMYQTINGAALIALSFFILVRQSRKETSGLRLGAKFVLATALALASLYNITSIFTVFASLIGVALFHGGDTLKDRIRHFVILGAAYGLVLAVIVGTYFILTPDRKGQENPLAWSDDQGTTQNVVDVEPVEDVFRAFLGFGKSHLVFPGVTVRNFRAFRAFWDATSSQQKIVLVAFYGLVGLVAAVPVALLYWKRKALAKRWRWLLLVVPLWFLGYAGFNWFWLPSDVHYWIVPMMIWWTVVGLLLSVIKVEWPRFHNIALGVVAAYIVLSFGLNLFNQFLPESNPDNIPWVAISNEMKLSDPNTLFVSDGHPLDFFLAYFSHRDIVSTDVVALASNDSIEHVQQSVSEHISAHAAVNGDVYVYARYDLDALLDLIGYSRDDVEVAWEFPDLTIYRLHYTLAD